MLKFPQHLRYAHVPLPMLPSRSPWPDHPLRPMLRSGLRSSHAPHALGATVSAAAVVWQPGPLCLHLLLHLCSVRNRPGPSTADNGPSFNRLHFRRIFVLRNPLDERLHRTQADASHPVPIPDPVPTLLLSPLDPYHIPPNTSPCLDCVRVCSHRDPRKQHQRKPSEFTTIKKARKITRRLREPTREMRSSEKGYLPEIICRVPHPCRVLRALSDAGGVKVLISCRFLLTVGAPCLAFFA